MLTTAFSLPCTSWDASGFDSLLQPDDSPPQAADGGLGLSVEEDLGNPLQGGALLKQAGGSHNSVKRNNSDSELLASITVVGVAGAMHCVCERKLRAGTVGMGRQGASVLPLRGCVTRSALSW